MRSRKSLCMYIVLVTILIVSSFYTVIPVWGAVHGPYPVNNYGSSPFPFRPVQNNNLFIAQGRYWAFGCEESFPQTGKFGWWSASQADPSSWSAFNYIRSFAETAENIAVDSNGTHVIWTVVEPGYDKIWYRMGELQTDGTIVWCDVEQLITSGGTNTLAYVDIVFDYTDSVWISYCQSPWSTGTPILTHTNMKDGTWVTAPENTYPGWGHGGDYHEWHSAITAIRDTAGNVFIVMVSATDDHSGRAVSNWHNHTDGQWTEEYIAMSEFYDNSFSLTSDPNTIDHVLLTHIHWDGGNLGSVLGYRFDLDTFLDNWDGPHTLESGLSTATYSASAPAISADEYGNGYVFWIDTDIKNIHYGMYTEATDTWAGGWEFYYDGINARYRYYIACSAVVFDNKVYVIKGRDTSTPYSFAGYYIDTDGSTTPSSDIVGVTTTFNNAENILYSHWTIDLGGMDKFIFGWNASGVWVNETAAPLSSNWGNTTKTNPALSGVVVGWQVWANSTSDEWGTTGLQTFTTLAPASTTSLTITDMDVTDNCYEMLKYYTFQVVVDDENGADTIANVSLRILDGAAVLAEVRAATLDGVPAYSIVSGGTEIDLDVSACSWGEVGDVGTATFKIRFEWDFTDTADLELSVLVTDEDGNTAGWTVEQTDYFDVIGRLVTSGLAANSTYIVTGEGVQINGTVYYATTVSGNIASSSYPLDAQFTAVHVHNASHDSEGNDATIVNGAFSVDFTVPGTRGAFTYHIYLDLVADYTDADAPDGDTITMHTISAALLMSFDGETGSTTEDVSGYNNDGTISGATRTGVGLYGRAISFDGTNDYILVGESATLNITGSLAITTWVYTCDPDIQGILYKTGAYGLSLISNYGVRFTINSTNLDTGPNVFNASTWTFVVGVYNTTHMLIYINGILDSYQATTGVVAINDNDLFIGNVTTNFFNGTIDEVRLLNYEPLVADIVGLMWDPIATFPYNLQGSITSMECTDWVFAGEAYEFVGEYVRQNASYPLDIVNYAFYDGVSWLIVTFNITGDEWDLSSSFAYSVLNTNITSGNAYNATWELYITEAVFDALNVDIYMRCNDTFGNSDGYEIVELNYFNIYNHGGMTEFETSGDGVAPIAGEGVFGLAARNSTEDSWAYANITWRKLQHVSFLVHIFQVTTWDAAGNYWNCPSEHNDTAQVEYGIDYWYDGDWVEGWKVRLTIEDGEAGTYGLATDNAWVLVNVSWYNRGSLVSSDLIYAYYEAINSTDTTTQFALYVDLWVGIEGGSSTVAGRVGAEYFGMSETGWGPWANWRPVAGLEDESTFSNNLLDNNSATISAEELELFIAWANLTKTSDQTGLGDPGCDTHQWRLVDYSGPFWRTLPPIDVMRGIAPPIPVDTVTPGEVSVGFFSALITAMIEGITKPIVAALGGGLTGLYFIMTALINSAFRFFIPGIDFVASITTMIGAYGGYLIDSMLGMTALVVQVFRIITRVSGFLLTWLTRMITLFINIWTIAGEIWSGTSTAITGLTDMWGLMNIDAWIDAVPIFIAIGWLDSIDKRARRVGGGWMSFLIGDLQMVSWVLSFLVEWFTRIIEFVINRVMQFINILPIRTR